MVSFAVAQLKSGASSQPTVNNLVSYTEEVFFFILFFLLNIMKMQLHGIFIFQLQFKGKQN